MAKKKTSKATSKTKASKKNNLKNMSQTHAMEEPKYAASTLDQIWGDTGLTKYQTLDSKEYKQTINNYNKSDLQTHASKVGLLPLDNVTMLKERLMSEFNRHVASYRKPVDNVNQPQKLSEASKRTLSEGR
jgi:hypothetical protein|tara:strand:+ start:208 stop:600 length:393 start_codon:yes stop_codon:yes gene_type:complete